MNKVSKIEDILESIPTPAYICEEALLEENLKRLAKVQEESGAKILLALKGYAYYPSFNLVRKYLKGACASGLHEAKLAKEELGLEVHTYSPAFKESEIEEIALLSNHLVFNSFSMANTFKHRVKAINPNISLGLRVNPECSSSPVDLYNPCAKHSRFGITKKEFDENALELIEGLHFHALCEQNVDALEESLQAFEEKFAHLLTQMKWVNFGGGHHITRKDYNVTRLIEVLRSFKKRYNNITIYLEPGEAVGWQTGPLVASVLDIIHNEMEIAILDTSAEAHMPDTLAMPYRAEIRHGGKANQKAYTYRLAGNTCLSGDIIGDYSFDKALKIGDKLIFEDMMHYTIVKNTTFNGIELPKVGILKKDGSLKITKTFSYEDYKHRLG